MGSRIRCAVYWIVVVGAVGLLAASCGGDDDDTGSDTGSEVAERSDDSSGDGSDEGSESSSAEGDGAAAAGGGNGGTLVLGEEDISLDSARCFLQEQDAAAGGGKILFVVQAFGTTAGGDELIVDISRYDEDSQFTGDDILVDIGDPLSADAVSWQANADLGTVDVDGSTVSADGLTFMNFDDFSELAGSFRINC